jgi:hypothetical protein
MSATLPSAGTFEVVFGTTAKTERGATAELDAAAVFGTVAELIAADRAAGLHADNANATIITIVTSKYLDFILLPPLIQSHLDWLNFLR